MSGDADETKAEQERTTKGEVIANKFTLTDNQGRERASLYVENDLTLFAFNDKDGEPVFSIAVSLSGFVMLSANHRKADGALSSSFKGSEETERGYKGNSRAKEKTQGSSACL